MTLRAVLLAAADSKVSSQPQSRPPTCEPARTLSKSALRSCSLTPARHHLPATAAEGRRVTAASAANTAASAANTVATAATTIAVATAAPFASSWEAAVRGAANLRNAAAGTKPDKQRPPSTSPKIYRNRQRTHTPLRLKVTIGALPFAWKAMYDCVAAR